MDQERQLPPGGGSVGASDERSTRADGNVNERAAVVAAQSGRIAEAMAVMSTEWRSALIAMGVHVVADIEGKSPRTVALELAEALPDDETWETDPFRKELHGVLGRARKLFVGAGVSIHTNLRRPQG